MLLAITGGRAEGQTLGLAPETPMALEQVVVTATRTEVPVRHVAAAITVITREQIEARRATELPALLAEVPGLSVTQLGSRGSIVTVFPRGGNSNFNLVLVDGVKVNDAGGFIDFADLSTDNIERIEIIRGPHSALYGADAMGSVIQIFTRKGRGAPRVETSFAGGNLTTFEERVALTGSAGGLGYSLAAGRTDTDGSLKINNAFRETTLSGRLDYTIPQMFDVAVAVRYTDSLFEFPTGGAGDRFDPLDPNQSSAQQRLVVSAKASHALAPWWQQTLQIGWHRRSRTDDDPRDPGIDLCASRSQNEERRVAAEYLWNLTAPTVLDLSNLVTAGFAYERTAFDQRTVVSECDFASVASIARDRDTRSFYLQDQLDWHKRLFLTAGFRVDTHTTFGTVVTPRLSAAYLVPVAGTKVRASYGEGIKEPTFVENFGTGSPFFRGNPDLKPERSESWEVGVDQSLLAGMVEVSATYFRSRFGDLIAFVGDPPPSPAFKNIQSARAQGVEVTARIRPGYGLVVSGSYTFLDTEVLDDGGVASAAVQRGRPLIRRPRHRGSLSLERVGERLRATLTTTVVGDRVDLDFRTFPSPRVTVPGYATVDLAGSYLLVRDLPHLRELTLFGKVQNLFDASYEQVFGFSAPRITVLLGLKGSL